MTHILIRNNDNFSIGKIGGVTHYLSKNEILKPFFFLTDKLAMIPEEGKTILVVRVDGSILCTFDMTDFKFVFKETTQTYDRVPSFILDKREGRLYTISVKSLLHLGATNPNVFASDIADAKDEKDEKDD